MIENHTDADEQPLKDPNQNPWYCLATLYGEYTGDVVTDYETYIKNRRAWNSHMVHGFFDKIVTRNQFKEEALKNGFTEQDFSSADTQQVQQEIISMFAARNMPIPDAKTPVNFDNLEFNKLLNLSYFLFPQKASFSKCQFNHEAKLLYSTFFDDTDFKGSKFNESANFNNCRFFKTVDFSLQFYSRHDYVDVHFKKKCYFESVIFTNDALFSNVIFFDDVSFFNTKFLRTSDFSSCEFYNKVDFVNTEFHNQLNLFGSQFRLLPPDFNGARLHEHTILEDISWPKTNGYYRKPIMQYVCLKREMEKQKRHQDELMFLALELRARRADTSIGLFRKTTLSWFINWVYDFTSHYGQSVGRPFLGLLGTLVFGAVAYSVTALAQGHELNYVRFKVIIGASFLNVFSFMPLKNGLTIINMTWYEHAIMGIQVAFSLLFLFLIGLALRNRFRMK